MNLPLIISGITFLVIFGGIMTVYTYLEEKYWRAVLARRLFDNKRDAETMTTRLNAPWMQSIQRLGRTAAPKDKSAISATRRLLSYAGLRDPNTVVLYYGIRIASMLGLGTLYLLMAILSGHWRPTVILMVFVPLAFGYSLPAFLLNVRVRSRQKQIFRELPNALDLVLICLEAGLSFDRSLYRVSRELGKVSPVMAQEFGQYYLEIQSGLPRKEILNQLAERNGVESLSSVVGVLAQSIRFGTDIAESLRVHIRSMRTRRRQDAEEQGAKISTRLTFPLVAMILPALFLVILGPALINLYQQIKGGF